MRSEHGVITRACTLSLFKYAPLPPLFICFVAHRLLSAAARVK